MPHIVCREAQLPSEAASSVSLNYLAEGAANVIFRIQPHTPDTAPVVLLDALESETKGEYNHQICPPEKYLGKVIRLSKGHEKTPHGRQVKLDFENVLAPLFQGFEEHLIDVEMVLLSDEILPSLNEQIYKHSQRHKRDLPPESVALIMDDYSSVPGTSVTIEIKPKWLAQSPNAPGNPYRCRTCALQAFRAQQKGTAADAYICPLELRAGHDPIIRDFILSKFQQEVDPVHSSVQSAVVNAMTEYLAKGQGHRLLNHIRDVQTRHDHSGVLALRGRRGEFDQDLQVAMTLRDCSLFVKVTYNTEELQVECKMADLDFKHEAKIEDWREKEEQLLNGGWYTYKVGEGKKMLEENCLVAKEFRKTVPYCW